MHNIGIMRWPLFIYLIFSCFSTTVLAQNLDSLRALAKSKAQSDTSRILTLTELAYELRRSKPDSSLSLATESLALSERIKYEKGKGRALRVIGIFHYLQSDYPKALKYYQEALELALKVNDQKNVANCYNNIGTISHSQSDYNGAIGYFLKALTIRKQINDQRGIAQVYGNLATVYQDQSSFDDAMDSFRKSLAIYEKINDKEGIASSYRNIGTVYRSLGNSKEALKYFLISLDKRKDVGLDKHGIAFLYNDLGSIYKEQGNFEKALQYFFDALKIQEDIGSKQGIAASHNNIGNIYKDQGNYDKALEYLISSMKIKEEIGSRIGMANSYSEIGSLYLEKKELRKAFENMLKSLNIRKDIGDKRGVAVTCARLADILIETGELQKAFSFLEQGFKITKEVKSDVLICDLYIVYAKYFNAINKYSQAYNYAVTAYDMATKVSNIEYQRNAAEQKSLAAENLGKYKEALESHKLFLKFNDSIQNLNSTKKSLTLEYMFKEEKAKIEGEKKELELLTVNEHQKRIAYTLGGVAVTLTIISLLIYRNNLLSRRANKILKLQKREIELAHNDLEKSDSIKNRLLSILSHDIRAPLNSLRGMLYLFDNDDLSPAELKKATVTVGDQVEQLNYFLDNLLRWTRNQVNNVKLRQQNLLVNQLVKGIVDLLLFNAQSKKITIETMIPHDMAICADEEMMKAVLRNLVTNAIKFCDENDKVSISAMQQGKMVKICVRDTGMGIAADNLPLLFGMNNISTKGTQNEVGTGLGLALCKEFVEKNGGQISATSVVGEGSCFEFTVPLAVHD